MKASIKERRIELFATREMKLESSMMKVCVLVKEQCSASLKAVLKAENDCKTKNRAQDVL